MRSRPVLLAAPLLLAPGVLACFSGGFFDTARLRAGVLAWVLLALVACSSRRPLPRSRPGRLALGGLAALRAAAAATGPLLGLAIYLTFSRGALGAVAAGLGLLVALVPTAAQLRAALLVGGTRALAAAATLALPAGANLG